MSTLLLRHMAKNQRGTITAVNVGGELGRRLREMGLIPGTHITICGRAPLRDPIALRLQDSTITLRNNEADHILVQVES